MSDTEERPKLPELAQGLLDEETLAALFRDIGACAQLLEIIVKGATTSRAEADSPSLTQAQALLGAGAVRGIQLRYRYDGAEWWDTLIRTPSGVKLVRIEQVWG